jgi:VRR-NUC domain
MGRRGLPDVLAVLPPAGRLLAVECKRAGRKPTPDQLRALEELHKRGALVCVAHAITDVDAMLTTL